MKYKNESVITLIITILVLFLKYINVLQIENNLGHPISMIILIIVFSFVAIYIQKDIDKNYQLKRLNYNNLDILKYISAILIVILHLRPFLNFSNELDLAFNNIITRICVPIFFVITGYFVAKKEKRNPNYIKDYIKKILPLYLVWSVIYIPVLIITIIQYFPLINEYLVNLNINSFLLVLLLIVLIPLVIFIVLVYMGVYYHLWYFPAVILSLVILDKWKKKISLKYLLILSFILLLFGATETYYGILPGSIKELLSFYYKIFFTTRNFLFFGLFYVVLGYYMGLKKEVYSNYCFEKFIISVFLLVFEAILLHDTERLNSNILLSCIPLVYYLFTSVIYMSNDMKIRVPFRELSKYYYLIHPMIIFCVSLLTANIIINPYLNTMLVLFFTHCLAMIIISLKRKYKSLVI